MRAARRLLLSSMLAAVGLLDSSVAPARAETCPVPSQATQGALAELAQQVDTAEAAGTDTAAAATGTWPRVVAFTAVDALAAERFGVSDGTRVAEVRAETARTDKQLGSVPSSSGTTSLSEKAGFAEILSLAVEHGAIQQERSGSSLTFSTSPYVLILLGREDDQETFNEFGWARRLGVSANFALDKSKSEGANDLKANDLANLGVRFRLYGDRSTRTRDFYDKWATEVLPEVTARLDSERNIMNGLMGDMALPLSQRTRELGTYKPAEGAKPAQTGEAIALIEEARTKLGARPSDAPGIKERRANLAAVVGQVLCETIFQPILSGEIAVEGFSDDQVRAMQDTIDEIALREAREMETLQGTIDSFKKNQPLITAAYGWQRIDDGSDYSEMKLLADGFFQPIDDLEWLKFSLNLNAVLSLHHDPDSSLGQDTVRDYSFTGSLERSWENPFSNTGLVNTDDLQPVSLSLSGRVMRQEDIDKTISSAQAKLTVPVFAGMSLPFSLTYSSRTETSAKDEVRVAVGIRMDTDKLMSLLSLPGTP